jgi:beta-mannosidase
MAPGPLMLAVSAASASGSSSDQFSLSPSDQLSIRLSFALAMARTVVDINSNWEFRQADKEDSKFLPVSQFPTNVHLDLLHHGLIPDPFIGKNELAVQWVGEATWTYRTTFTSPPVPTGARAVLAFDGLDTFAVVKLNGTTILESDNMFLPYRVDVSAHLAPEGNSNELSITFDSAYLRGCELVEKYPDHKWGCWNGDTSRLAVRKAQYHWVCALL